MGAREVSRCWKRMVQGIGWSGGLASHRYPDNRWILKYGTRAIEYLVFVQEQR